MKKWLKLLSAALLFLPAAASAQWTTDYSKNTQVAPVGLNYDENEVVTTTTASLTPSSSSSPTAHST